MMNTRAPVVYAYELKGAPCVQEMTIQTKQPLQFT
jgi:hypothetical protein